MRVCYTVELDVPANTEPAAVKHWIEKTLRAGNNGGWYRVDGVSKQWELISEEERLAELAGSGGDT